MFAKIYKDGTSFDTEETLHAGLKQGIFIDIFPYDYLPADQKADHRLRRGARFWQSVSYLYHSPVIVVPHKGFVGRLEKICLPSRFIGLFDVRQTRSASLRNI